MFIHVLEVREISVSESDNSYDSEIDELRD